MKKTFKGRAVLPGNFKGEAAVSPRGFNILASFQKDLMAKKAEVRCHDQGNPELFGVPVTGRVLCLPATIGSTTGGMVLQAAASLGKAPLLFSDSIDSLAAAGVVLAKVWNEKHIITVDRLGDDFLTCAATGDIIEIHDDGTVILEKKERGHE